MSKRKTDMGTTSSPQYTRSYDGIRGVDFSSDPSMAALNRSPNLLNMYRDYDSEHGAAIETIPGYRRLFDFSEAVHGIWGYASSQDEKREEYVIVHAGRKLYAFKFEERDSGLCEECFDGLADGDSSAFVQNNRLYICDGEGIFVLFPHVPAEDEGEEDGEKPPTFDVENLEDSAYIPITYLSGAAYEQRNMISDRFINRDTAVSNGLFEDTVEEYYNYNEKDNSEEWAALIKKFEYTEVVEGNKTFLNITDIKGDSRVFDELDARELLRSCYWFDSNSDGFDKVCYFRLTPELVEKREIKRIIGAVSDDISAVVEECYSGEDASTPMYGHYCADLVIYEPCVEMHKVKVNGKAIPSYPFPEDWEGDRDIFYMPVKERLTVDGENVWYYSLIHIYSKDKSVIDAAEVDIYGIAAPVKLQTTGGAARHTDYLNANKEYTGSSVKAVTNCTLCAVFDGRVFLTGNKRLPNTVFYSCRDLTGYNNPTYFGVYNYFNDGTDNAPNTALLATSSVLMVLKGNTMNSSSIYYHTGAEGPDDIVPRIYPSVPGVAGIGCKGAALNFLDDAVFISDRGLEGVSKQALNSERTIGHRSSTIDRMLKGDGGDVLGGVKICRWGGYICLIDGMGRMFLGDSRQIFAGIDGESEYEWFFLDGVGAYNGDTPVYKTLTVLPPSYIGGYIDGKAIVSAPDEEYIPFSEVLEGFADCIEGRKYAYYVKRDGCVYLCDTEGELEGGDFFPATVGYSVRGVMLFGTSGGHVCCFNTDKRGMSVDDENVDSDRIHRSFYSFAGHRYESRVAYKSDNCGVPHFTKRTSRKTCVLKLKAMQGSDVEVKVRTDRESWEAVETSGSNNIFSFDDMDFGNFTFDSDDETIVVVKEKKKKWVEKQFLIRSNKYNSPFGVYGLSFNYEIQGRVKK